MTPHSVLSSNRLDNIYKFVCMCFVLDLVVNEFCITASCHNYADKFVSKQRSKVNERPKERAHLSSPSHIYRYASQHQQRHLDADQGVRAIEDTEDNKSSGQTKSVQPSQETDSNGQVVYVNLARVVNDGISKNESTRVIDNSGQLIKQDGQISCGETNRNGKTSVTDSIPNRIVGGTKADPGEFPYQVRLNIRSRRGSSLCGGVIIDQRHILTAAHCMTTW